MLHLAQGAAVCLLHQTRTGSCRHRLQAWKGLLNLSGSTHVRAVYCLWHYPHQFYRIVGLVELVAALFLIVSETRVWSIAAAGIIMFVTVVTLLHHRQYLWSLLAILLLVSLIPASLVRA